ncbi:MAG: lipopolysaccharide biosynthesis protein [Bacteroidota bacterium]|nr:lipopolysaccharide biosynthesis protein [Bacteroidota bacterium]
MGVVIRQSFKTSIVNYIGISISILSTIYVYPRDLSFYGIYNFIFGLSVTLGPVMNLGMTSAIMRFMPKLHEDAEQKKKLLSYIIVISLLGFLLFAGIFFILKELFFSIGIYSGKTYSAYLYFLIPLVLCNSFISLFTNYCITFGRSALPALINALLKIYLPILFLLYLNNLISSYYFFITICLLQLGQLALLVLYIKSLNQFKVSFHWADLKITDHTIIKKFAFYSLLSSALLIVITQLSGVLVATVLGPEAMGKYSILTFIASSSYIPALSIFTIITPIIVKSLAENNVEKLKSDYISGSINSLIITLFLAIILWISFPSFLVIMPNSDKLLNLHWVFAILLLTKIIEVFYFMNNYFISYSDFYRIELIFLSALAIIGILLNYLLIPPFGLMGAALASCISISLYNLLKSIFVYRKFNLIPYNNQIVKLIIWTMVLVIINAFIPYLANPYLDLFIRNIIICTVFLAFIIKFKISREVNHLFYSNWRKIFRTQPTKV